MKRGNSGEPGCYEVTLNYACNARCAFCSQGSFDKALDKPFSAAAAEVYRAYRAGYRRIGFTGGEPLLRRDIVKLTALARSVGFRFIRVQTNGIKLADAGLCRQLARAGLTFCKFSFASDRAAEHDALTGVKGSFAKASAGLKNMGELKVRLGCNLLVTRRTYRRLPGMLDTFLGLGVRSFVAIYPVYTGAMAANAGKLGVSLPACAGYFSAAARLVEEKGLEDGLLFLNVPPCFLPGRESAAIGTGRFNTVVSDPLGAVSDLDANAGLAKVRAPACRRCRLRRVCAGVDSRYAALFGFAGFRPAGPARRGKNSASPSGRLLSDGERCVVEILSRSGPSSTKKILRLAKDIVLCRDCADGNSVLNAASSLVKKGLLRMSRSAGEYTWSLAERGDRG